MSSHKVSILEKLDLFGLSRYEAQIFVALVENGASTALSLSKVLGAPRTRVYRVLDELIRKGLVVQRIGTHGYIFEVLSYKDLDKIIAGEQRSVDLLKKTVPLIYDQLAALEEMGSRSRILQYSGVDGLKQVAWHTLRAKDELLIFENPEVSVFLNLDYDFVEKVRAGYVDREIHVRELTNDRSFEGWTDNQLFVKKFWDSRSIVAADLMIEFEFFIYNDVFVAYDNHDEVFALEIYNQDLADMQKQLFWFIWDKADKMTIGERGAGRLR